MAESAYAKDIHERSTPGLYAPSQSFPIIAMWHESLATNEVIHYIALRGSEQELAQTRRLLYARYGMELGGQLSGVGDVNGLQIGGVYQIVGALGGHALASMQNEGLIAVEPPPPSTPPASSFSTEQAPMRR